MNIRAFSAGRAPPRAAQQMADAAEAHLQLTLAHLGPGPGPSPGPSSGPGPSPGPSSGPGPSPGPRSGPRWLVDKVVSCDTTSLGSGVGILLVAETSTGCILGAEGGGGVWGGREVESWGEDWVMMLK